MSSSCSGDWLDNDAIFCLAIIGCASGLAALGTIWTYVPWWLGLLCVPALMIGTITCAWTALNSKGNSSG